MVAPQADTNEFLHAKSGWLAAVRANERDDGRGQCQQDRGYMSCEHLDQRGSVQQGPALARRHDEERQAKLLAELWRVCRKGLFVTTPNRWFPVELHSSMPLIHWLPATAFRRIMRSLGYHELADEANLNLMSRVDLVNAAAAAGIPAARVEQARLAGWTSNLLLIAHKPGPVGARSGRTADHIDA
jgi:hypothetical protein